MENCTGNWCGRGHSETREGKSPYQLFLKYKLPTVWRVLHEQLLYPAIRNGYQSLSPLDFRPRQELCHWFLRQCDEHPCFRSHHVLNRRSTFHKEQHTKFIYHAYLDSRKPTQTNTIQTSTINVWSGIVDCSVEPYIPPQKLHGAAYLHIRSNFVGVTGYYPAAGYSTKRLVHTWRYPSPFQITSRLITLEDE
jgi:hypothetical protein